MFSIVLKYAHILRERLVINNSRQGGGKMKTKTLVYGVGIIVAVLVSVYSFADDKEKYGFYVPKPNEEIFGTWVNKDYSGTRLVHPQKLVFRFWGYEEVYDKITDNNSSYQDTFFIVDKWTDSEGNIWYKVYEQTGQYRYGWFSLIRISKGGTVFEHINTEYPMMWPTESDLNPDNPNYRIFYRQ